MSKRKKQAHSVSPADKNVRAKNSSAFFCRKEEYFPRLFNKMLEDLLMRTCTFVTNLKKIELKKNKNNDKANQQYK